MDSNANTSFRSKTKIVAIVDLVLTSISFLLLLVGFLVLLGYTAFIIAALNGNGSQQVQDPFSLGTNSDIDLRSRILNSNEDDGTDIKEHKTILIVLVVFLWFVLLISTMLLVLQIIAAVKLLNSTQIGADPIIASRQARFWRSLTIVFTVFAVLNLVLGRSAVNPIASLILLLLRLLGLWVVHQFIKELDARCTLPTTQVYYNVSESGGQMVQGAPLYPVLSGPGQPHGFVYGAPPGMDYNQGQGYGYAPPPNYEEANKGQKH